MKIEDIHTITHSLSDTHFGQALDCLLRCREDLKHPIEENRNAISTIVHAFLGLESAINLVGDNLFSNEESHIFISVNDRDYALNRLIQSWSTMPTLKKLDFLFSYSEGVGLSSNLKSQIIELNNLRNWIVHGFVYKETLLLEETGEDSYNLIDRELHIDWEKKFPTTKFNTLSDLNKNDAFLALKICLEIAKNISIKFQQPFSIIRTYGEIKYNIIHQDSDIEKIIND
jgi:hypothetical protein